LFNVNFELVVDIEFEILDAAVNECLPGYAPAGWVEFTRREITPASTLYEMYLQREGDLGDLGQLIVRKVAAAKALMYFKEPKRPSARRPSQQDWDDQHFSQYPLEERIRRKFDFLSKYQEEADDLHRRRREHQRRVVQALFSRLSNDTATAVAFSGRSPPSPTPLSPLEEARREVEEFRSLVERQLHGDLTEDGPSQEKQIRGLLQACLTRRSYREVPVRAGRSDILVHLTEGRLLFETKIWRGESTYDGGLAELSEYIKGENSDGGLLGAFYVVCDPTESHSALAHIGADHTSVEVSGIPVDVYVVDLSPDTPSTKGSA
jgi:hypothetical protein